MIRKVGYTTRVAIGDWCWIDGDKSGRVRVIQVTFHQAGCFVEVSWMHNGTMQSCWVADWRLEDAT